MFSVVELLLFYVCLSLLALWLLDCLEPENRHSYFSRGDAGKRIIRTPQVMRISQRSCTEAWTIEWQVVQVRRVSWSAPLRKINTLYSAGIITNCCIQLSVPEYLLRVQPGLSRHFSNPCSPTSNRHTSSKYTNIQDDFDFGARGGQLLLQQWSTSLLVASLTLCLVQC
jgi:hypothetical protein